MSKVVAVPTVDEAERVIKHLLSYPDGCDDTLDAVRHIMQWLGFEKRTEMSLAAHARMLRKPIPEGCDPEVNHVPTTRSQTTWIVEGVLNGYLDWLRKNHPMQGTDVDPDYERMKPIRDALSQPAQITKRVHDSHYFVVHTTQDGTHMVTCTKCGLDDSNVSLLLEPCGKTSGAQPTPEAMSAPHPSHNVLDFQAYDVLGFHEQYGVCGYCGKTDETELTQPCSEVERMNREEDEERQTLALNVSQLTLRNELTEAIQGQLDAELGDAYDCTRVWEAWSVGTMSEDDFVPVDQRTSEIAQEIVNKIAPMIEAYGEPPLPDEAPDGEKTPLARLCIAHRDLFKAIYGRRDQGVAVLERQLYKLFVESQRALEYDEAMENFPSLKLTHGPLDASPIIGWWQKYATPLLSRRKR